MLWLSHALGHGRRMGFKGHFVACQAHSGEQCMLRGSVSLKRSFVCRKAGRIESFSIA